MDTVNQSVSEYSAVGHFTSKRALSRYAHFDKCNVEQHPFAHMSSTLTHYSLHRASRSFGEYNKIQLSGARQYSLVRSPALFYTLLLFNPHLL